jgi:hypothetical protein
MWKQLGDENARKIEKIVLLVARFTVLNGFIKVVLGQHDMAGAAGARDCCSLCVRCKGSRLLRHLQANDPSHAPSKSTLFLCAVANMLSPTTPCGVSQATHELTSSRNRGHHLAMNNISSG